VVALAQALSEAPGSAVLAIELARAAKREHDTNRYQRYRQLALRSVEAFPSTMRAFESLDTPRAPSTSVHSTAPSSSSARPMMRLDRVTALSDVCQQLKDLFQQGKPPVDYVGEQGTHKLTCELQPTYNLAPQLTASVVLMRAQGNSDDARTFAWVAVARSSVVWLSSCVVQSFAPAIHPSGNGFKVELERTEAYPSGHPELTAYITARDTILDVALNEMLVRDRVVVFVSTFDVEPPLISSPILLHERLERSLIDPSDDALPTGYRHSNDIGKPSDTSFRLEWGNNQVRLTDMSLPDAKPQVLPLFNATKPPT
jgi:hypothetical protein